MDPDQTAPTLWVCMVFQGLNSLLLVYHQERAICRSGVRSAVRAASELPGREPTDVDDAPAPARYQKSDYDMM